MPRYLDDVVEQTGITERNVKYWSQKFNLPVEKDGRRNVYPDRTVKLLKLVELLSGTELFTHRFIQLQVHRALGFEENEIDFLERYERVRKSARDLLDSMDSSRGTRVLPPIQSGGKRSGKKRSSRRRSGGSSQELDEDLL